MVEKILLKLRNGITNDQQWFFNHLNWGLKRAKNDQNDVSLKNDREDKSFCTICNKPKIREDAGVFRVRENIRVRSLTTKIPQDTKKCYIDVVYTRTLTLTTT